MAPRGRPVRHRVGPPSFYPWNKPILNPPLDSELGLEQFCVDDPDTSELRLVVLNRRISIGKFREFWHKTFRKRSLANFDIWSVIWTTSRQRYLSARKRTKFASYRSAKRAMQAEWQDIQQNGEDLPWNNEFTRLRAKIEFLQGWGNLTDTHGQGPPNAFWDPEAGKKPAAKANTGQQKDKAPRDPQIDAVYWLPWNILGLGANGAAIQYLKVNGYDTIIDMAACKICRATEDGHGLDWPHDEIHYHRKSNLQHDEGEEDFIIVFRAGRCVGESPAAADNYLVAMDVAPHGSLTDLMRRYMRNSLWTPPAGAQAPPRRVPEPFCWAVLYALARAGTSMMDIPRTAEESTMVLPGGRTIPPDYNTIHQDIKPSNIFLGHLNNARWNVYPEVLLGDFGLAERASIHLPRHEMAPGTPGFRAPECNSDLGLQMNQKLDVWSSGTVLWCMMHNLTHPTNYFSWEDEDALAPGETLLPPQKVRRSFSTRVNAAYSDTLIELVRDCMSYRSSDRPDFWALADRALEAIDNTMAAQYDWDAAEVQIPADDDPYGLTTPYDHQVRFTPAVLFIDAAIDNTNWL